MKGRSRLLFLIVIFSLFFIFSISAVQNLSEITNTSINATAYRITFDVTSDSNATIFYGTTTKSYAYNISNISYIQTHNISIVNLSVNTTYFYYIFVANTSTTNETSEFNFTTIFADIEFPWWENNVTYPVSPVVYEKDLTHQFNVTWHDYNMSYVEIEHNFTGTHVNYSVSGNISNTTFYYNYTTLTPGNYTWKMHGYDKSGNHNETGWFHYNFLKANSTLNLTLNFQEDNITIEKGEYVLINATRIVGVRNLTLYVNGVVSNTSENPTMNVSFGSVGTNTISVVHENHENYTYAIKTLIVTVIDTTPSNITVSSPLNNTYYSTPWLYMSIETSEAAFCEYKLMNNTYDFSGNNNDGYMYGDMLWNHNGSIGGAYDFDGVDDYINISNDESLNSGSFSVALWLKTNDLRIQGIMHKKDSVWSEGWRLFLQANKIEFDASGEIGNIQTGVLNEFEWYHLVVTYNSSNNVSKIYLNSTFEASATNVDMQNNNLQDIQISSSENNLWNGTLDNIKLYNRVLTDIEISADYNGSHNTNGLVLYLPFDQDNYTTDYSSNNNTGYIHGASWTRNGINNGAYDFDGVDDYIQVKHTQNSNIDFDSNDNITFSAWIKTTPSDNYQSIIDKRNTHGYLLSITPTGNLDGYITDDNSNSSGNKTLKTITDDSWHFVSFVINRSSNAYLYIDGVLNTTFPVTNVSNLSNSADLIIGQGNLTLSGSIHGYFNGSIDEVRIYNKILSATEILSNYNGVPITDGLVLYLPFNKTNLYNRTTEIDSNSSYSYMDLRDSSNYNLDIMCTDLYNNTANSYVYNLGIDTIEPELWINYPNETVTVTNRKIELNYSLNESNLNYTWYTNDYNISHNLLSYDNTQGINLENITFDYPGKHLLSIFVNDTFGNTATDTVTLYVNDYLNTTQWKTNFMLYQSNITGLNILNDSDEVYNINITMNQNLTLEINMTNITAYVYNFSALETMWEFFFGIEDNSSYVVSQINTLYGKQPIDYLHVKNFSKFFSNESAYYGKVALPSNISGYDLIYYCSEDDLSDCVQVSVCTYNYTKLNTSACYLTDTENVNVYVPAFGSVLGINDSISPTITFTLPTNNSIVTESYNQNFSFTTNEESTCTYSFDETLFASLGTETSFRKMLNYTENKYMNLTISCTDASSNSVTSQIFYTVSDTTAPAIVTYSPTNEPDEIEIYFTTDDPANSTIERLGNETKTITDYEFSHRKSFTNLTEDTEYTFNITICDWLDNCYSELKIVETDSVGGTGGSNDGGGGGGGGSSGSGSTTENYVYNTVFFSLAKGNHAINIASTEIAITRISLDLKHTVNGTILFTVHRKDLPAIYPGLIDPYQYVSIDKTVLTNEDILSASIRFRVENDWIETNGIDKDTIKLYRYTTKWNELPTEKLSHDSKYTYYESVTTGFSYFGIKGEKASEQTETEINQNETDDDSEITANVIDDIDPDDTQEVPTDPKNNDDSDSSLSPLAIIIPIIIVILVIIVIGVILLTGKKSVEKPIQPLQQGQQSQNALGQQPSGMVLSDQSLSQQASQPLQQTQEKQPMDFALDSQGIDPELQGLVDYVSQCRSQGIEEHSIKEVLIHTGWNEEIINKIMSTEHMPAEDIQMITTYIITLRNNNIQDYEIRQNLKEAGWQGYAIEEAFSSLEKEQRSKTQVQDFSEPVNQQPPTNNDNNDMFI